MDRPRPVRPQWPNCKRCSWPRLHLDTRGLTVQSTASTPAVPPAEQLARARARANPDTMETAATLRALAPPPRTRQRMGLTARFTVQDYTALSAEQLAIARVHVTRDMEEVAARLPARAPPPQTRPRMGATVLSTASTPVLLVEQPGRASARANPGI